VRLRACSYHVPLCVPYWNGATYREIARSLLSGSVINGLDLDRLSSSIIDKLGVQEAVPCGSGKLALEIALRACHVAEGDDVVIPTFCCTSVVLPILAVGALPVLADIGADLNLTTDTVAAVLTKKTTAVIVPHLFGNPADITAIIKLVSARGIRVIDDAAQALGAMAEGQPVGSFGDAGIVSFGEEKVCFGLGGGVAVSGEKGFLNGGLGIDLAPAQLSLAMRGLVSTFIWRRWRRWTPPVRAALSPVNALRPDLPPAPYRKEAMANLHAAVAVSLVENLEQNVSARRARVEAYQQLLGKEERLVLIPHRRGSACLTQVLRILPRRSGDELSAELVTMLGDAGYEVQGSYLPIHLLSHYQQWVRKPLPYAEQVWDQLIELPCEPEVSFAHLERIASIVKRAVKT
jgi:dTDP-4-amino-4,6-dideoxygalactose transaminase